MLNKHNISQKDEIRSEFSLEEAIYQIKEAYQSEYDPERPNFDAWNQLLACEAIAESTPITQEHRTESNENPSVNGVMNDGCKLNVIFALTQNKQKVISKLKEYNYQTPPAEITILLKEFFKEWESKQGHWLFIAQHWTPRAIIRTITQLIKIHESGQETIYNPSAYFTFLVKRRKRRKIFKKYGKKY